MAEPPFHVQAVHDYVSEFNEDLNFSVGQRIEVTALEGDEWYTGFYVDSDGTRRSGLFPTNFVEKSEFAIPVRPSRSDLGRPFATQDGGDTNLADLSKARADKEVSPPGDIRLDAATDVEPLTVVKVDSIEPSKLTPKAAPPPIAPKSSAFKDRIAAFNKAEQPPVKPLQLSQRSHQTSFIKKPFVAPPPSSDSYVPLPHKSRAIAESKQMSEETQRPEVPTIAAPNADTTRQAQHRGEGVTDAAVASPKPLSLKERMAMLEEQQRLQVERQEIVLRKENSNNLESDTHLQTKLVARSLGPEADGRNVAIASTEQRPHDINLATVLSDRDVHTDRDRDSVPTPQDHVDTVATSAQDVSTDLDFSERATSHSREAEEIVGTGIRDHTPDEVVDEEELRRQRLRERMARLAGPQGGVAMPFNPFNFSAIKKREPAEPRNDLDESVNSSPRLANTVTASDQHDTNSGNVQLSTRDSDHFARPILHSSIEVQRQPPCSIDEQQLTSEEDGSATSPKVEPQSIVRTTLYSPGPGSESDDELSTHAVQSSAEGLNDPIMSLDTAGTDTGTTVVSPKYVTNLGAARESPSYSEEGGDDDDEKDILERHDKGTTQNADLDVVKRLPPPPPIPSSIPLSSIQEHLYDSAFDAGSKRDKGSGGSDYEGDYDTDIPSGEKRKDALKLHKAVTNDQQSSIGEVGAANNSHKTTVPAPLQYAKVPGVSAGVRRPPIPIPTPRMDLDDGHDSFLDSRPIRSDTDCRKDDDIRPVDHAAIDSIDDPMLAFERTTMNRMIARPPPPPPPMEYPAKSQEIEEDRYREEEVPQQAMATEMIPQTSSITNRLGTFARRSVEHGRILDDVGILACELELDTSSSWWATSDPVPPVLRSRIGVDILLESEETKAVKRGGRVMISKDIYVLFADYSQSIITAHFDFREPSNVSFDQRQEEPPSKLRQDQLEAAWQRFGSRIEQNMRSMVAQKKESLQGDGRPQDLPSALIRMFPVALSPVGVRAYGALVYMNIANASTVQFDEIRSGDIVTFRNARFEGHHGAIKQKYKQDYGQYHAGIVDEWDGTKRSLRAWEQGREKKNAIRSEKFRLRDLRSGEVRVWRVVGREWVGWDSSE